MQIQDGARDTGSPILEPEVGDSQSSFHSTDMTPATDASISTMLDKLKTALCSEKTEGLLEAHNDLAEAHVALENKVRYLEGKITDNEERDRRNNIRIRGIPENVGPQDLPQFVQKLFKSMIPTLTEADL
ncbi:Hypothetical predicted protein [Pelobates cultripes]|uniref:Uncharacterized protein n=1 Tax=Pelobates cultripes TaxID=61616 RepID=A0AAD1R079_PELCU|nr:Hypothetical predicted protein [Pelobates cultripes]